MYSKHHVENAIGQPYRRRAGTEKMKSDGAEAAAKGLLGALNRIPVSSGPLFGNHATILLFVRSTHDTMSLGRSLFTQERIFGNATRKVGR